MLLPWSKQIAAEPLVGLDIGPDFIKIVRANIASSPITIENITSIPIPPGVIVKGEIKEAATLAELIKTTFKQLRIPSRSVAMSIPRTTVIMKDIPIDARLENSEIESRAWIEANHHFPDLIGDIYLDFVLTPIEAEPQQLNMMLVACRKDQIDPYLDLLQRSELKAKVVDVNSFALQRALTPLLADRNDTVALLNLDTTVSTFLVVSNGKLIYAHDHTYEGKRLITQTQTYLKTSPEAIASLNDLGYIDNLKSALSAHLRHSLHFFYSSRPNINLQTLYVSGDCALTPCLPEFIQQETGIHTTLANPYANAQFKDNALKEQYAAEGPLYMLAYGLALSVDQAEVEATPHAN